MMTCLAPALAPAIAGPRSEREPRVMLSQHDYVALLNLRLRLHPMYLEGMAFPVVSSSELVGLTSLASMVQDTRWDRLGVFASVIDEVCQGFELSR